MFLILLIIATLGLVSITVGLLTAASYGIALILLVEFIRNVRQEISRESLARLVYLVAVDHFLSAAIAVTLSLVMIFAPQMRDYFPLINGPKVENETLVVSIALCLVCLAILWSAVGALLLVVQQSLKARGSLQSELDIEPWLTVMLVVGLALQLLTLGFSLLICAPFLLQVRLLARINRQSNLLWTLTLAVRRGLPLGQEIRNLSAGLWGRQRLRLELLSENLDSGQSLSNSLERQPGLVPLSIITQLRTGEETGTLKEVLAQCGARQVQYYSKEEDVTAIQNAFMILLLPVTFLPLIIGFLGYYIVPKHKKIFEDFGVTPTDFSKFVFALLDPGLGFPALMAMFAIGCVAFTVMILTRDRERDWPVLCWLFPRSNSPLILRSLALLIRENRPLTTGLRALEDSHPRPSVRTLLKRVLTRIDQGADAWESMTKQRLINSHELLLLRAAERVRNLPWALEQIAATIERRSWIRLRVVLELVFPVVAIGIGLIVLGFAIVFVMPSFLTLQHLAGIR